MDSARALCDLLSVHEDDDKSFEYLLERLGFTFLDHGCWKVVYRSKKFPDVVLKRSRESDAKCCCEVENYETAPAHIKPHLLPLLAHSRRLQVQPFVHFCECPDDCPKYVRGMFDSGWGNHTHDESGRLVIVDYGQDRQWNLEEAA